MLLCLSRLYSGLERGRRLHPLAAVAETGVRPENIGMAPRRPPHWSFRLTNTISGWFGGTNPAEWLTIGSISFHADLHEIDGRRYLDRKSVV